MNWWTRYLLLIAIRIIPRTTQTASGQCRMKNWRTFGKCRNTWISRPKRVRNLGNDWLATVRDSVKWLMKNWAMKKRLRWTLKIADILVWGRLSPSLTASKRTAVGCLPTAKNSRTDSFSVAHSSVAVLFDVIKDIAADAVAGLLPQAQNLRTDRGLCL